MIDEATRQQILDAANILEVVSDYVSMKKRGVNYVGCCPFHNEKTPSFTVSPSKGIFKCFGCGKGGDVVHFVMEHEQIGYYDALRRLAERYHIKIEERELTPKEIAERGERESMLVLNNFAQKFFVDSLLDTDEGKSVGLEYLRQRGLDMDAIDKFGLGYNPSGWDVFTKAALEAGYKREYLLKTGLSLESQSGNLVDRFHDRVIFPIKDITGRVIAFGGRIMSSEKSVAKYQNSPESEIYHKKSTLYGIDLARASIVRLDRCYLVEGYLDVISMHRRGFENTVASSGTSLTTEQIRMLLRLTHNVTVMYDGDSAGIHAALRGIDMLLQEGLNVKVVLLPEGEDPDSYAQSHSADEIADYIKENEVDFITFKTRLLLKDAGSDPIERAKAINDVVRSISFVSDNIARALYVQSCSTLMNISERALNEAIAKLLRTGASARGASGSGSYGSSGSASGSGSGSSSGSVGEFGVSGASGSSGATDGSASASGSESSDASASGAGGASAPTKRSRVCRREEMELVKALLLYGKIPISDGAATDGDATSQVASGASDASDSTGASSAQTSGVRDVATYMAEDLREDGLKFFNDDLAHIFDEYIEHKDEPSFDAVRYFASSEDSAISSMVAELVSEKYVLESIWDKDKKKDKKKKEEKEKREREMKSKEGSEMELGDQVELEGKQGKPEDELESEEEPKEEKSPEKIRGMIYDLLCSYKLKRVTLRMKQIDMKVKELEASDEEGASEQISEWLRRKQGLNQVKVQIVHEMRRN